MTTENFLGNTVLPADIPFERSMTGFENLKYLGGYSGIGGYALSGVSPVVWRGDTVVFVSHALRMPAKRGDKCTLAWELSGEVLGKLTALNHIAKYVPGQPYRVRGMGPHAASTPVIIDEKMHYSAEGALYSIVDVNTGNYFAGLGLSKMNWAGLSAAGGKVFATSGGQVQIIEPSATSAKGILAANAFPRTSSIRISPAPLAFHGRKLFLRTAEELFCIGKE